MAFCTSCGAEVGGAAFCSKCGASQAAPASGSAGAAAAASTPVSSSPVVATDGLAENVAGALCYAGAWVTGIIFLLIDKRPFVRFHAAQSIVVFGGLTILRVAIARMFWTGGLLGFGMWGMIISLINIASLVLWIFLMYKAYQHELFKVPIADGIAESIAGK